ncbi:MAG: hypothetical protein AAF333_04615 [Planctomycetota bacterium]
MQRCLFWLCLIVLGGASLLPGAGGAAWGQLDEVRIAVRPGYAGLDGFIRPGAWTPIRLSVDNLSADDRDVFVAWEHRDADGDRVVAQRRVTLTRQREDQPVWLYASVPATTGSDTRWNLRVVDAESGQLLATLTVQPNAEALLRDGETLIAVTSPADLGLTDFERHDTTHAPVKLVRGLSLSRLPDRWQGLEALGAFVWTPDQGGDPADPLVTSDAALAALREWIYRGGHLVVMLPQVGQTWTGSPLADMLPVDAGQLRPVESEDWWSHEWIAGRMDPEDRAPLAMTTFGVADEGGRATVLLRDTQDRPIAVAGRYGFGRVTVVGMDLTAPVVRDSGLHRGEQRLWHHVFNWRSPAMLESDAEDFTRDNEMIAARRLARATGATVELGGFIPNQIAMTGTIGALLIGAIVWFGLYWLLAGWLLQPVLKRRGWERWSWVGFVAVVLGFAGVAWGGASLLRPGRTSVAHVTVVDYDGNAGVARGRAYVSLFVPRFDTAEVAVGPDAADQASSGVGDSAFPGAHNLVSSPGLSDAATRAGFIDPQRYAVEAASPDAVGLPMRSTSKQLVLDYLGPVDRDLPGLAEPFSIGAPEAITADRAGWPTGELFHTLPGTLTNVQVVICRGELYDENGQRRPSVPQVWRYVNPEGENRWAPGEPLTLAGAPPAGERVPLYPAFRKWAELPDNRDWKNEGLLGMRLGDEGGVVTDLVTAVDESVIARRMELLSFFEAVPPPDIKRDPDSTVGLNDGRVLARTLGQRLDLTPLTQGRRVIVLGHLKDSPLPIPFTVDGQTPPSAGWTVVRWVYDF